MATILVVDDVPTNRQFLTTLLGYSGHHLLEAADGLEGLAQVRALCPDLVIADLRMPTMDGFEFVRQLRADPAHASTNVIFYTAAYSEAEVRALGDFLQGYIRGGDIACRYGGEECTLILPETPLTVLLQRAEQVCTDARRLVVQHRHETLGPITLSLGLAVCPEHGTTADVLLRAADAALYRAKAAGRDRVVVAPAAIKETHEDHSAGR